MLGVVLVRYMNVYIQREIEMLTTSIPRLVVVHVSVYGICLPPKLRGRGEVIFKNDVYVQ